MQQLVGKLTKYNQRSALESLNAGNFAAALFEVAIQLGFIAEKSELHELTGDDGTLMCSLASHDAHWQNHWKRGEVAAARHVAATKRDAGRLEKSLLHIASLSTGSDDKSLCVMVELAFELGRLERMLLSEKLSSELHAILIRGSRFDMKSVPRGFRVPTRSEYNPQAFIGEASPHVAESVMVYFIDQMMDVQIRAKEMVTGIKLN